MTSRDFAFWLQGFFEVSKAKELTEEQTNQVKAHLNLVFVHEIDPSMGDQAHQDVLNEIHSKRKERPTNPDLARFLKDADGPIMRC